MMADDSSAAAPMTPTGGASAALTAKTHAVLKLQMGERGELLVVRWGSLMLEIKIA